MSNSDFILAVHALVYLNHKASVGDGSSALQNSQELAENICTNPARVRRVMALLKKNGLVETKEGRIDGGYVFIGPPERVTLEKIAKALSVSFVSASWRSGDPHMACRVASGISGVMDGILADLDEACFEKLKHITISDIDATLFAPQQL